MSNGAKVALAVGAGYLLGRTRKMRVALMLAAAGVTGKFPARASDLVAHGLKSIGTSNQVGELADQLRGELFSAARAAAVAAATSRVDALNDRIQGLAPPSAATDAVGRTTAVLDDEDEYEDAEIVDEDRDEDVDEDRGEDVDEDRDEEVDEDVDEDEDVEAEPDEDTGEEAGQRPRARPRRRATRQETAPRPARRRRAAAATRRAAPVRRGR